MEKIHLGWILLKLSKILHYMVIEKNYRKQYLENKLKILKYIYLYSFLDKS